MANKKKIYRKSRYDILLNKPGRIVYINLLPPPQKVFSGTIGVTGVEYGGMTGLQGITGTRGVTRMPNGMTGGFFGVIGMFQHSRLFPDIPVFLSTGGQGSTGTGRMPAAETLIRAASRRSFLNRIREMLRQV